MTRRRGAAFAALEIALVAPLLACLSSPPLPAPAGGGVAVDPATALEFHRDAGAFYRRLTARRFNTLETFSDPLLRRRFASLDFFFDYYADLARALDEAHFEKSRPHVVEIQEFLFVDPQHARVQVRFVGRDGRPLRPDRTEVLRQDHWVRSDDTWRLDPQPAPAQAAPEASLGG